MIDFVRNWTKSAEEKRQEALNAYLDDALAPKERRQFERLLAEDAGLQAELAQRRALKAHLRQLPRRRAPRNFTLDPAVYGRPQRQPLFQLYPTMRTAAALTAFFFILAIAADLFLPGPGALSLGGAASQEVAVFEDAAEEAAPFAAEGETVEVTRVVTETVIETELVEEPAAAAMAVEEPAAEEALVEPAEDEFMAEEPMAAEAPALEAADSATDVDAAGALAEATAVLPTPSPAPTAIAATKSTVPRPAAATDMAPRASEAVPTPLPQTVLESDETVMATATAVPPAPEPASQPANLLRLLQIGLGALLIVLGTAVFYVRRQTF